MSQTLFLVRLRSAYRRVYDYESQCIVGAGSQPRATFSNRLAAEHYCQNHSPIEVNPFCRNDFFCHSHEDGSEGMVFENYSGVRHRMDWQVFFARLRDQGWSRPEEYWEKASWIPWWDALCAGGSAEERETNRVLLGLPNWGENPFAHMDWCADSDWSVWESTYYIDSKEIGAFLDRCGISQPKADSESEWEVWWDENAPRMTDEQKAALWHLLDPQPWEIVEVELEVGR